MANKHYSFDEEFDLDLKLKIKIKSISDFFPLTENQIKEHIKEFKEKIAEHIISKISGEHQQEEVTSRIDYWDYNIEKRNIRQYNNNLTIIVATDKNRGIGLNNSMIWHFPNDFKRFKALTTGHHIIMGRKTFESLPGVLPGRTHIVITRQTNYKVPKGVVTVNSLEEAIEISRFDDQPFIIGGGEIYKKAMKIAKTIELTKIQNEYTVDTVFPKIDPEVWEIQAIKINEIDEKHKHKYSFMRYVRY